MPDDRPTTDFKQSRFDKRLVEFERFLKENPKGVTFGEILKHFTHASTKDAETYSVDDKTLYRYAEREEKIGNIEFKYGRYFWIKDDCDKILFRFLEDSNK